jgi:Flp pilus assembly pilin Flp
MFRSPATRALAGWVHVREALAPYLARPVRALALTESGTTAVEYALIIGGIALGIVGVVNLLGDDLAAIFQTVDTKLTSGTPT